MNVQSVQPLSAWLQDSDPAHAYLLLSVASCGLLANAYGSLRFRQALVSALEQRLLPYGVTDSDILVLDHLVLVALADFHLPAQEDRESFLQHIKVRLSYEPIQCGTHTVLLHVRAAWIEAPVNSQCRTAGFRSLARAIAFSELHASSDLQFQADIALAGQFFTRMRDEQVVLAFQPIVKSADTSQVLSYEVLLRWKPDGQEGAFVSCAAAIQALERLHCIERLDASVLYSVVQVLQQQPDLHLACNISPLSLQQRAWWRLLCSVLSKAPQVAVRLTLEITETAAVFDLKEAVNLLNTLRALGCKIALDDMGAGFNTLELARQIRPDVIKIDKAVLHQARQQAGFAHFQDWVQASYELSQYVIAEGIETEQDVQLCMQAGVHAIQGYLIQVPSTQPPWKQAQPVPVRDSFNPAYPIPSDSPAS